MTRIGRPIYPDELMHYRTKNSKNGVRLYQYEDGSLTPAGRVHYGVGPPRKLSYDERNPVKQAKSDIVYAKNYQKQIKPYAKEREKDLRTYAKKQKQGLLEPKHMYEMRKASLDHDLKATELRWQMVNEEGWARQMPAIKDRVKRYQSMYKEIGDVISILDKRVAGGEELSKKAAKDYKKLQKRYAAYGSAIERYINSNLSLEK